MRSWILLLALSTMLAVAAACGGDDDESADESVSESNTTEATESSETEVPEQTEEPEPTETPEPEPTEEPEPTASPEPQGEDEDAVADEEATEDEEGTDEEAEDTTADNETAGTGELDPLLLSVEELPEGWTEVEGEAIEVEDEDLADVSEEPFEAPCGIEPLDESFDPVAEADREFQGTELGPFFSQNLMQLESADDAQEAMSVMREIFNCDEWSEMDEFGEEITFSVEEVPIEDVGDDVFSIQLALSFDTEETSELDMFGEFDFEIVVLQRGEYLSMMMYFDLFGMSEADFESIVRSADEKIQSAS